MKVWLAILTILVLLFAWWGIWGLEQAIEIGSMLWNLNLN